MHEQKTSKLTNKQQKSVTRTYIASNSDFSNALGLPPEVGITQAVRTTAIL
jgi:hypothetical protein